jgi:hypothetical protein
MRVVRPAHLVHMYYGFEQFGATLSESYSCRQRLSNPDPVRELQLQTTTEQPSAEQLWRSLPRGALDRQKGGGELNTMIDHHLIKLVIETVSG